MKHQLKVGDKVLVLPRKDGQRRASPGYVDEMTEIAGRVFAVARAGEWVRLANTGIADFSWNPDWLLPVTDEQAERLGFKAQQYPASVGGYSITYKDGGDIRVGRTEVPFDTLKAIYKEAKRRRSE